MASKPLNFVIRNMESLVLKVHLLFSYSPYLTLTFAEKLGVACLRKLVDHWILRPIVASRNTAVSFETCRSDPWLSSRKEDDANPLQMA